jgi:hypothetical protein
MRGTSVKRAPLVAGAVVLVSAAVIVYHNALSASFFDDDFQWLVGSRSFHPSQLVAFGTLSHFYRPVIDLYFGVATPLFSGSPVLFHLASIVLHAANALVIFALARLIARSTLFGFLTALFFVVQPSDIDAIAWVGALAEAVGVFFGCLSLLFFLLEGGSFGRRLSILTFLLALLTHESSVVFLPVLALADWAFSETGHRDTETRRTLASLTRRYSPYVALTIAYLGIDLWINSRNYLVSQGHYTIGLHVVQNALNYIDALYVGRRDALNYAVIAIGVVVLLLRGNRRVRFATVWMLLSLAPFLFFNWANTSRYLYQPAIGFSMLLAEAVMYLDRVMRTRTPAFTRVAILTALVAGITIRFALFAMGNVKDFAERSRVYPNYIARFREIHGNIPSNTVVPRDPRLEVKLPYQFVNAAVQWEYRDPTIQIAPYEYDR